MHPSSSYNAIYTAGSNLQAQGKWRLLKGNFFSLTEVASRLSRKCTEQLVMDNALNVIFKVVRDSNRSLAHMGLIKLALDIFVNVSKVSIYCK